MSERHAPHAIIEVPIPGVRGTNISTPDAETGIAALREAQKMFAEGLPAKVILNTLRIKYGTDEVIQAICAAVGQDELRRAQKAGRIYSLTIESGQYDPEWEDKPD